MGHTLSIHCEDPEVIRQFGLEKPAFRICVNTPATHGSIGLSTSLPPSMTLGCGTYGNNITTDNITPLHLIQIKRLAWETREVLPSWLRSLDRDSGENVRVGKPGATRSTPTGASVSALVEEYLTSRGIKNGVAGKPAASAEVSIPAESGTSPAPKPETNPSLPPAVEFVCEQDVRTALQARGKIYIDAKTIITPAARDLGAAHEVFVKV
jgi:acetaldehyde dehydrogenase (acetylating)